MFMLKAIIGAVIAGLGALVTALTDENVTSGEWAVIALATVIALGTVYGVPNLGTPPPPPPVKGPEL